MDVNCRSYRAQLPGDSPKEKSDVSEWKNIYICLQNIKDFWSVLDK